MYPGNELNTELIMSLINKAYWPIYGEIAIREDVNMNMGKCLREGDGDETKCPTQSGRYFSFFVLIGYMIIANVLLINLLIAMFTSTYEDVQDKTDRIWKFQRYRLVFEYYDRSAFPPPISIIGYVIAIVKYVRERRGRNINNRSAGNKTDDASAVRDDGEEFFLERKFAEEYVRNKKILERDSVEARLRYNNEKLEYLEQKINESVETQNKDINQVRIIIYYTNLSKNKQFIIIV